MSMLTWHITAQITHCAFCAWLELLRDSLNRITVTLFQQSTKEDFTAQITHYAFCAWLELLRDSINRITVTLFQQSTRGDFNEKWIYKCQ